MLQSQPERRSAWSGAVAGCTCSEGDSLGLSVCSQWGCLHSHPRPQPAPSRWPWRVPTITWASSWHHWIPRGGLGQPLNMINGAVKLGTLSPLSYLIPTNCLQGQVYQPQLTDGRLKPSKLNNVPTDRSKQVNLDFTQGLLPLASKLVPVTLPRRYDDLRADSECLSSNPLCWWHLKILGETVERESQLVFPEPTCPLLLSYSRKSTRLGVREPRFEAWTPLLLMFSVHSAKSPPLSGLQFLWLWVSIFETSIASGNPYGYYFLSYIKCSTF